MPEALLQPYTPYLLIAFGILIFLFSMFYKPAKNKLFETGESVEGIVFEGSSNFSSGVNSAHSANDTIIIRFVTRQKEWITGPIEQDFQLSYPGQYKKGDMVTVFYNKDKPTEFVVQIKQPQWLGRLIPAIMGIIITGIGIYKFFTEIY
jgi:hypothetical protein